MSQENVKIVRRGFAHYEQTGEFRRELVTPDFVWDMSKFRGWPEQQIYEGLDGVRDFVGDWTEVFVDLEIEIEAFHDAGEQVVVLLHQRGRLKAAETPIDMRFAQVWTVRDGLEARVEPYADWAEALEAAGLPHS